MTKRTEICLHSKNERVKKSGMQKKELKTDEFRICKRKKLIQNMTLERRYSLTIIYQIHGVTLSG